MEREKSPEVYQSNPLIEARKPMNALEMRLFLLAVAAVNPHLSEKDKYYDHEFKELHLKPGELKAIFGNGSYLTRLEEVCDGLMERTIKLRDGKGGFVIYTVFDVIRYKPKDGLRIQFNHN
ncbi:replication initiation protein, partial [Mitsuokella jalaludinii]